MIHLYVHQPGLTLPRSTAKVKVSRLDVCYRNSTWSPASTAKTVMLDFERVSVADLYEGKRLDDAAAECAGIIGLARRAFPKAKIGMYQVPAVNWNQFDYKTYHDRYHSIMHEYAYYAMPACYLTSGYTGEHIMPCIQSCMDRGWLTMPIVNTCYNAGDTGTTDNGKIPLGHFELMIGAMYDAGIRHFGLWDWFKVSDAKYVRNLLGAMA